MHGTTTATAVTAASLGLVFALGGPSPAATPRGAAPPTAGLFDVRMDTVADGIWVFSEIRGFRLNPVVSGNIIAVAGSKAILVFDAGHHPGATRAVIGQIRKLSPLPVRWLAISHWHDDHWVASYVFDDSFPGIVEVATPFTARLIAQQREASLGDSCARTNRNEGQQIHDQLALGKHRDGTPLEAPLRERLTQWAEVLDSTAAECAELRYRAPDRTVDSALDIDLGGRTVSLRWLGRANTAGDLIAWVPDAKTLLTGDIVVAPWPFATQSYIGEWGRVLRKLEAMRPAVIVPGHGQVMHDLDYVRQVAELMESIDRQARAAYTPGMTADSLRAHIDVKDLRERFAHGDAFIADNFDYMILQDAVNREWQELAGRLEPEGDTEED